MCVLQQGIGHAHSKCTVVLRAESRKTILHRYNRCFICLGKGHIAKKLSSRYAVKNVGLVSITYLFVPLRCLDSMLSSRGGDEPGTEKEDSLGSKQDFVGHTSGDKLLQAAKVDISSMDEPQRASTRALSDSGSQKTYASEKVRNRLELRVLRTERVIIKTFGQKERS